MTPAERAAELLPCRCLDGFHKDTEACPRTHRPTVASALAEKDKEIEQVEAASRVYMAERNALRQNFNDANAKVHELTRELEYCKRLAIEADDRDDRRLVAAKIEGLVYALQVAELDVSQPTAAATIRAEIAALERGKEES